MTTHPRADRPRLRRRLATAGLWSVFVVALVASQAVLYEPGLVMLLLDPELVAVMVVAGVALLRYDLVAMAGGLLWPRRAARSATDDADA